MLDPLSVVTPNLVLIVAVVSSPVLVPVMASSLVRSAPALSAVAVPALPDIVVWSPVLVPDAVPVPVA